MQIPFFELGWPGRSGKVESPNSTRIGGQRNAPLPQRQPARADGVRACAIISDSKTSMPPKVVLSITAGSLQCSKTWRTLAAKSHVMAISCWLTTTYLTVSCDCLLVWSSKFQSSLGPRPIHRERFHPRLYHRGNFVPRQVVADTRVRRSVAKSRSPANN